MLLIARIFGLSLLTSAFGAGIGWVLFQGPYSDYIIPTLLFASVGGMIGALAGAAREIAMALRQRPSVQK